MLRPPLGRTLESRVAEAEVDRHDNHDERAKRIQGAIAEMLKKFPPPPQKK